MTLDELRSQLASLEGLPGDTIVVLAKDSEGNSYSPLYSLDHAYYAAETTYYGDRYASDEERAAEPGEWSEPPEEAVKAVYLWPTN